MTESLTGVALCDSFDLVGTFGPGFAARAPHLRLLRPAEVEDPAEIAFAVAFHPADDAFAPYPALRAVFNAGAGVERVLACPSRPAEVPLIRMTDADQADQMAAFALFQIVFWQRRFDRMLAAQADGAWRDPGVALSPRGFRVGVLGLGFLGRRIAEAVSALGYPVRGFSRGAGPELAGVERFHGAASFDAFLDGLDALVSVLPHTPETEGVLDRSVFARMRRGAAVINIGRGAHLAEAELIPALDDGLLAGASLDVFAQEPLPADHPFWADPRILVTPHVASDPAPERLAEADAFGLAALAEGRRPEGLVNAAAGY